MPYHCEYSRPYFYIPTDQSSRGYIIEDAKVEARSQVNTDYPYAVYRDQQEVTQHAQQVYQEWITYIQEKLREIYRKETQRELNSHLGEIKRLYISAFVVKYMEEVAEKDAEAQPKPAATPSPTGATITVTRAEHTADVHRYWLKLEDPKHLDEPYEYPELPVLRVDFSDATDIGTVASSGTVARASASSDAVAPSSSDKPKWTYIIPATPAERKAQTQSKSPQSKKPRISWEK